MGLLPSGLHFQQDPVVVVVSNSFQQVRSHFTPSEELPAEAFAAGRGRLCERSGPCRVGSSSSSSVDSQAPPSYSRLGAVKVAVIHQYTRRKNIC